MRVLCIIQFLDGIGRPARGNDRLIRGILQLANHCKFDLLMKPELTDKISRGYTGLDLQREYNPDVVVVYGSFVKELFDDFFTQMTCAKTVVMTDPVNYVQTNPGVMEAHKRSGFDILFMRGTYPKTYKFASSMVCTPFSVDEKEFYPNKSVTRANRIGFVGTTGVPVYTTRRKAIKLLKKAKLLNRCPKGKCNKGNVEKNKGYPLFLRSHVACLTSTEHYNWPPDLRAKTFEITASGTVLLSPYFLGIEEMVGKDGVHYVQYNKNCSDVVKKAREIINNPDWARTIAKNGYEVTIKKHTDKVRAQEIYGHLVRLIEGKPIQKQYLWEQEQE